jgi:hypothetical protein
MRMLSGMPPASGPAPLVCENAGTEKIKIAIVDAAKTVFMRTLLA